MSNGNGLLFQSCDSKVSADYSGFKHERITQLKPQGNTMVERSINSLSKNQSKQWLLLDKIINGV